MSVFKKLVVYFFSGTGNSENVARWMAEIAKEKGMEVSLINIGKTERRHIEFPNPDALVAFVSPVHGFNYPPVMLHFIHRFPKGRNSILLMNTRAGMLLGKWITPGVSGVTFYLSGLILKLKGYTINAMFPVDLPSNWISVHPGLNERTVKYLHEKNKERICRFAQKVFSGKKVFSGLYDIIQDILISPVSIGYYFGGRFFFAKTFFASSDCNNCNLCIRECPVKAIKKVDNRPFWTFNCESCMHCMGNCPKRAIETGHGYSIVYLMLFYMGISGLFFQQFGNFVFRIENGLLKFVIETGVFLAILWFWHRAVHYLMKFRFFERLMVSTSLTKYQFWGRRYKALKKD